MASTKIKIDFGKKPELSGSPLDNAMENAMPDSSKKDLSGSGDLLSHLEDIKSAIQSGDTKSALTLIDKCIQEQGSEEASESPEMGQSPNSKAGGFKEALSKILGE